ncbi:MAG: C10 family peptidase [Bacteroidales bacterium]|nr:C10 family peptidase [Bacteroidales bacterium]
MNIKNLLFYTVFALTFGLMTFVGCSREPIPAVDGETEAVSESPLSRLTDEEFFALADYLSPTRVNVQEAMATAEEAISLLEKAELATKSVIRRPVSAKPFLGSISGGKTKSGDAKDTLAYIVSFGEGKGYAVISADHRTKSILAIIPEGDYEPDNIAPGAAAVLANIGAYLEGQIEAREEENSKHLPNALKILGEYLADTEVGTRITKGDGFDLSEFMQPTVSYTEVSRQETQISPLITTKWGQRGPYNTQCPIVQEPEYDDDGVLVGYNDVHALTGCVATATAQIMAYWEYPSGYDWSAMKANPYGRNVTTAAQYDIARLMRHIGDGVNMSYGWDGSRAFSRDVPSYLSSVGYLNYGDVFTINNASSSPYSGTILSDLQIDRPVIMAAGDTNSNERHSFIVDGIQRLKINYIRTVTFYTLISVNPPLKEVSYIEERPFFEITDTYHCNFGWGGSSDGWYQAGMLEVGIYNFEENCYIVHNIEP